MHIGTGIAERLGLLDGRKARLRVVEAADATGLAAFYSALSIETSQFRFFSAWRPSTQDTERLVMPDDCTFAIVAESDEYGLRRIVGDARWTGAHDGAAEMAIAVADDYQGTGLGKAMFRRLAAEATMQGIHTFTATVLGRNERMRRLLEWWGYAIIGHDGVDSVQTTMATGGGMPGWLPRRQATARVLIEGPGWSGRADFEELRQAGYHVIQCQGPAPDRRGRACPLLTGRGCPLSDGADVIVFALRRGEACTSAVAAAHRSWHRDVPVVTGSATTARTEVEQALRASV